MQGSPSWFTGAVIAPSRTPHSLMFRRILLLTVALGAVVWLYANLRDASSRAGQDGLKALRIAAHEPPVGLLRERAAAEEREAATLIAGAELSELHAAWDALSLAQADAARGAAKNVPPEIETRMQQAVKNWLGRNGADRFGAAGVAPWRQFFAAYDALRTRSRSNRRGLIAQLASDPPALQETFGRGCGEFLAFADALGVMDRDGQLALSDDLLRLVFRYRWLAQARETRPLQSLMTPIELDTFWRWRIEQGRKLPPETVARFVADFVAQRGGYAGKDGDYALPAVFLLRGEPAFAYDALQLLQKSRPTPETERLIAAVARLAKPAP